MMIANDCCQLAGGSVETTTTTTTTSLTWCLLFVPVSHHLGVDAGYEETVAVVVGW